VAGRFAKLLVGADMTTDSDYYRRRLVEERAAAVAATDAAIGKRHTELADLYDEKLKAISSENEPSPRQMLKMAFESTKLTASG